LDTSFLIALERETALGEIGPARRFLSSLRRRPILVSIVSVEEVLEGAADQATAESLNADVVGADRAAFERLGARYLRFR
jgi:predicted nucleic acid-binding protein